MKGSPEASQTVQQYVIKGVGGLELVPITMLWGTYYVIKGGPQLSPHYAERRQYLRLPM